MYNWGEQKGHLMLFSPEMFKILQAEMLNHLNSEAELDYYAWKEQIAYEIMVGERDVYAMNDLTKEIEQVYNLDHLRQFARKHKCCSAYAVPAGAEFTGWDNYPDSIYDLGDFGEYGVEAGDILAYMLPYDGPELEDETDFEWPEYMVKISSHAELLKQLRTPLSLEDIQADES